jgi:hypothetical protein
MSIGRLKLRVLGCGLALTAVAGLTSCGGGGGGGAGASSASLVAVSAPATNGGALVSSEALLIGQKVAANVTYQPYVTNPNNPTLGANGVPLPVIPGLTPPASWGSANPTVAAPTFAVPAAGAQSFLEFEFGSPMKASTIDSTVVGVPDGISLFYVAGGTPPTLINGAAAMSLDPLGVIDPTNVVTADATPTRVRYYYDSDGDLTTPDALPSGQYLLRFNNSLRTADGRVFSNGLTTPGVSTTSSIPAMPSWGFTLGVDVIPLDWTGPSSGITINGVSANGASGAALDAEIVINFNDAVDFPNLVGPNNLSSRDPFITQPLNLPQPGGDALLGTGDDSATTTAGALTLNYLLPTDPISNTPQQLPFDLSGTITPLFQGGCGPHTGVVIYMPDAKFNPTQVRIRFVDTVGLVGVENVLAGQYQNYASNPDKFPIRSTNPALFNAQTGAPLLRLPPILKLPGSIATTPLSALAQVNLQIAATATDRALNPGTAQAVTFAFAAGVKPPINPQSADLIIVGVQTGGAAPFTSPGLGAINTAANIPFGLLTGNIRYEPRPLSDPTVLGQPIDVELDQACNPFNLQQSIAVGVIPGIPDTPTQSASDGAMPPNTQAPWGHRMYVIDGTSNTLKVFNSFDFSLMSTIPGIASPGGLSMSPGLTDLYVTNTSQGTVQRIEVNPLSTLFGTVTQTATVGAGPRAIQVTPSSEDVFVANFSENSVSVLSKLTLTQRLKFATGLGPSEVFCTNRMIGMGLTNDYQTFVVCTFGNQIDIYESGGGAEISTYPDGRLVGSTSGFTNPKRGAWNHRTYIGTLEPGVLVPNGNLISEFTMFFFVLTPLPGVAGLPFRRDFHIQRSFNAGTLVPGQVPGDCLLDPGSVPPPFPPNVPNFGKVGKNNFADNSPTLALLACYPGAGKVVVFDYLGSSTPISAINVPGCDFLVSYFD